MVGSRMFPFITHTHNLIPEAVCPYECSYCWSRAKGFMGRIVRPEVKNRRWERRFGKGDFVFLNDLYDGMAFSIGTIARFYAFASRSPDAKFLFMTKNPARYLDLIPPANCVLGATIECDCDSYSISKAPSPRERLDAMFKLKALGRWDLFVSIEPILDFTVSAFPELLIDLNPWAVAVGYDNYNYRLLEPKLAHTKGLMEVLRFNGIKVYEKTLRPAWWE